MHPNHRYHHVALRQDERLHRFATLWVGIPVVLTVSLFGFFAYVGENSWSARLVTVVSMLTLAIAAGITVLCADSRRRKNQSEKSER